jgi:hypothetical protein
MKKQIAFYVVWDLFIFMFFYAFSGAIYAAKLHMGRTMESFPVISISLCGLILCGAMIALYVFISGRFPLTVRSSILEFVLVGVPALYLGTGYFIPFLLTGIGFENVRLYLPMFLYRDGIPMYVGCILFGYELFTLVMRLIRIRKAPKGALE